MNSHPSPPLARVASAHPSPWGSPSKLPRAAVQAADAIVKAVTLKTSKVLHCGEQAALHHLDDLKSRHFKLLAQVDSLTFSHISACSHVHVLVSAGAGQDAKLAASGIANTPAEAASPKETGAVDANVAM